MGGFVIFSYTSISHYLHGNSQYRQEQPPPPYQPFLSWKTDKDATKMLQRCIFLPSRSCWRTTPVTEYCCASNHHSLWGIWEIQAAISIEATYKNCLEILACLLLMEVNTLPFTREQIHVLCWLQGYKRGYLLLILNFQSDRMSDSPKYWQDSFNKWFASFLLEKKRNKECCIIMSNNNQAIIIHFPSK